MLDSQVAHALGFAAVVEDVLGGHPLGFLDLGSGGGLPGLVLAWRWPGSAAVLLDANRRRCLGLEAAAADLGWRGRVEVVCARAEQAGRSGLRGSQGLVVSRSFGRPAVTAECAAPLLEVGGVLVVSEPPDLDRSPGSGGQSDDERGDAAAAGSDRWPAGPLMELGLRRLGRRVHGFTYQVLVQEQSCPERYPRRVGIPAKRPLYR